MNKRLTIPVFNNRVSPLFDVAGRFRIVDIWDGKIKETFYIDTSGDFGTQRVDALIKNKVNLIICSAISRFFAEYIIANGIELIPGVIGNPNEIIQAYLSDCLWNDQYTMPGCQWRKRYRGERFPGYQEILKHSCKKRRARK